MFLKTNISLNKFEILYSDINYGTFLVQLVSNVEEKEYVNKYIGKVISVDNNLKYKNTKLIIYTKKKDNYQYGDIIKIEGTFNYANISRNYKGFNYRKSLWQKNIYGILDAEKILKISKKENIESNLNNFKLNLEKNIKSCIRDEQYISFLNGILLGDTSEISEELKLDFRNASLSHILAISGMHITYIILLVDKILNFINSRKIKKIISIIIIFLFVIMIGKTPSSLRALIMFGMIVIAEFLYRKSDVFINWCVSLIIILIINPMYIENLGVWLSFGGTLGIIKIYSKNTKKFKNKILDYIYQNFILSICVQICIFPVIVYNFNTISLTFFLSNIAISFLIAPIMFLGFVISFFGNFLFFGKFISKIEIFLIKIIFLSTKFVSNISLSKIYVKTPNVIVLILYYIILYLFITNKNFLIRLLKKYKKKIISSILIICIISSLIKITKNNFEIYFIDVGQGDCTLIKTETNKTILIDGGEGNSDKHDQGEYTVLPYLLDRGITKLDYIIISHFDSDHCGGLFYIIENLKVKNIIIGLQLEKYPHYINLLNLIKNKKINLIVVENGNKIRIDKTSYIDILWPDRNNLVQENSINNNSIVAKFFYKNKSILFTGDIEKIAEEKIINLHGNNLKSDILKSPHHGSNSSSINDFINLVNPQIVLIGVGKDNSYGHPSLLVLERYISNNIKIYRTDLMGEIVIKFKNKKIEVKEKIK